jgi:NADPH:quinone reductase-like Zn-dependent oxidoreductase
VTLLAKGLIRPIIAERLSLQDVGRAHELMENGLVSGKLVLVPGQE